MRKASSAMSWVAEAKATSRASRARGSTPWSGLCNAMPTRPMMMSSCAASSQLLRRPSQRVNRGMGMRSTSGAQTHLNPYASPTQPRKLMVARSIPASRRRKLKVPSTSNNGKPAENPSSSMRRLAGSRYTRIDCAHVGDGEDWSVTRRIPGKNSGNQVPRTNGLVRRSCPKLLSGPCPGTNTVASPMGHRRCLMLSMSCS